MTVMCLLQGFAFSGFAPRPLLAMVLRLAVAMLLGIGSAGAQQNASAMKALRERLLGGKSDMDPNVPPSTSLIAARRQLHDLLLLHIPKTAGASLFQQLQVNFDIRGTTVSSETCLPPYHEGNTPRVVMLRAPRAHVVSQYLECRYSRWGKWLQQKFPGFRSSYVDNMSDIAGMTKWTDHFLRHAWAPFAQPDAIDYHCYDPRDMQTRALTCRSNATFASHAAPAKWRGDASAAVRNAQAPGIILTLTELYRASVCHVHWQLQQRLPQGCACADVAAVAANQTMGLVRVTHGIPHLEVDELPSALVEQIDRLTATDAVVYAVLARKALGAMRDAERDANTSFVCADELQKLASALQVR